jgi:hypothetical protein
MHLLKVLEKCVEIQLDEPGDLELIYRRGGWFGAKKNIVLVSFSVYEKLKISLYL